jgi:aryl-alcohol dehydrogenase-like predicted oxidoreductase
LLTGKYNQGIPEGTRASLKDLEWLRENFEGEDAEKNIEKIKKLVPVSQELKCSLAQLALAWCLKNKNVSSVITGASKAEQVKENMKAIDLLPALNDEIMSKIETILDNKPETLSDYR